MTRACFKTAARIDRFIISLSVGLDDEANDERRCSHRDDLSNLTDRVKDGVRENVGKKKKTESYNVCWKHKGIWAKCKRS